MGDSKREDAGRDQGRDAGPDTRFVDLEISHVLFGEAEKITREAFRELLKEEAKARFVERMGDRIKALAELAVDELVADVEANLALESTIRGRGERRAGLGERVRAIFGAAPAEAEADGDEADGDADEGERDGG